MMLTSTLNEIKSQQGYSYKMSVCLSVCYLLEEASRVFTDLREAGNYVVEVEVRQSGVISTLPLHLKQQQVPAVHR